MIRERGSQGACMCIVLRVTLLGRAPTKHPAAKGGVLSICVLCALKNGERALSLIEGRWYHDHLLKICRCVLGWAVEEHWGTLAL